MKTIILAAVMALCLTTQATAGDKLRVTLTDGSVIYVQNDKLIFDVETKYGTLKMPVKNLDNISVGYHLTEEETKEISKSISDLGSSSYVERQNATDALNKFGERAYVLVYAINSKDAEIQKRIAVFVETTKPNPNKVFDRIACDDMSIKGHILTKKIIVKHESLGELSILMMNIAEINGFGNTSIDITADTSWIEIPNFKVYANEKYIIEAVGKVDCYPGQNGQYVSDPNGLSNVNGKLAPFKAGALIGRVENGLPFIIGDKLTFVPSSEGRVYLKIVENPWNTSSEGKYHVNIKR